MRTLQFSSDQLVRRYHKQFDIDISHLIESPRIELARDPRTGIWQFEGCRAGDDDFYRRLSELSYYYDDNRWEYAAGLARIVETQPRDAAILDIGCGGGEFLSACRDRAFSRLLGSEFSSAAREQCRDRRLAVTAQTLEELIDEGRQFDVVTAFQVLEHVADPLFFLQSVHRLLRPGGTFLCGTPNADSFLKHLRWHLLDMPPHHLTRWDETTYRTLMPKIGLSVVDVRREPLATYHHRIYADARVQWSASIPGFRSVCKRISRRHLAMHRRPETLTGQSMLVQMTATESIGLETLGQPPIDTQPARDTQPAAVSSADRGRVGMSPASVRVV